MEIRFIYMKEIIHNIKVTTPEDLIISRIFSKKLVQ